jgi:hypothetical protein
LSPGQFGNRWNHGRGWSPDWAGELLFEPLRCEVGLRVKLVAVESVPILSAALGRNAGILGAAAVALDA